MYHRVALGPAVRGGIVPFAERHREREQKGGTKFGCLPAGGL